MNKKNLVLAGVLVVLVAIAFASGPLKEWSKSLKQPKNFMAGIDVEQIEKISIKNASGDITLEKVTSGEENSEVKWRIEGTKDFYVKENDDFLDKLKIATEAEVEIVSENKENKGDFEVSEETSTKVKLLKGEEVLAEFLVGKTGSDYVSSYVSQLEGEKTYLIKAALNNLFVRDEWYDKTIFETDVEKVTKVRFQYPSREFTIEKADDKWGGILPYKFRVTEEKVQEILDIMTNLKATEIPAQTFEGTGLEKHLIIVQATGEEGIDNTIMIGEEKMDGEGNGTGLFYVKSGSSDNIYLITTEQRDMLDKKFWELR